jgi:hypothetical protein
MSDLPREHRDIQPTQKADSSEDAHLEEEEKLLDGRQDVNYPALLTRDVKGG